MTRVRLAAVCLLVVAGAQAYAFSTSYGSSSWSEILSFRAAVPTVADPPTVSTNPSVHGPWVSQTRRIDLGTYLRAARQTVASQASSWRDEHWGEFALRARSWRDEHWGTVASRASSWHVQWDGVWQQRGMLRDEAAARIRRGLVWLRANTAPPVLRARGAALRQRSGAVANRTKFVLAFVGRRIRAGAPMVARQLHTALDGLAAELGILPLVHGCGHLLRGLILVGGRLADRVHSHYRPGAEGECKFRSLGAFSRHFALNPSVLEARRAGSCQALKRAARQVLVQFHPDKMAGNYAGCSAKLSSPSMQDFLAEYSEAKAALCGR
ncbi:hypothetical protein T492DRAFT_937008 [Pavlovales sp. CCMP2436]|nr:hypothetical protein T492DRAFT_937008 [Pavlovales sp. CCMP2436]